MIDFLICISDVLRNILFFVLVGYVPLKIGIGEIAFKAPTTNEVRTSRDELIERLFEGGVRAVLFSPFRVFAIFYFTIWLLVDKNIWFVVALFLLTLIPVYIS